MKKDVLYEKKVRAENKNKLQVIKIKFVSSNPWLVMQYANDLGIEQAVKPTNKKKLAEGQKLF